MPAASVRLKTVCEEVEETRPSDTERDLQDDPGTRALLVRLASAGLAVPIDPEPEVTKPAVTGVRLLQCPDQFAAATAVERLGRLIDWLNDPARAPAAARE